MERLLISEVSSVPIKNLGELVGRFHRLGMDVNESHDDVRAWGAPSECHDLVNQGYERAFVKLEEELKVTWPVLKAHARRRVGDRWMHFNVAVFLTSASAPDPIGSTMEWLNKQSNPKGGSYNG